MPCSDLSVYIIDDNPEELELLRESFDEECHGVQVRYMSTVDEAIAIISSVQPGKVPDAVLIDYRLPRSSGMEVIKELGKHKHWEKVPRIMMTGSADASMREQCRRAGADEIFVKPSEFSGYLQFARELTVRMRKARPKVP